MTTVILKILGLTNNMNELHIAPLVDIPTAIVILAVRVKVCTVFTAITKYESIITKKKKKHDKIVLLTKTELRAEWICFSKRVKRIWWYERNNYKSKNLYSSSKILIYLWNNILVWSKEKKTESKKQRQIKEKWCFHQNVQYVIVKKSRFIKNQEANW